LSGSGSPPALAVGGVEDAQRRVVVLLLEAACRLARLGFSVDAPGDRFRGEPAGPALDLQAQPTIGAELAYRRRIAQARLVAAEGDRGVGFAGMAFKLGKDQFVGVQKGLDRLVHGFGVRHGAGKQRHQKAA
jgi:hypothetical protein